MNSTNILVQKAMVQNAIDATYTACFNNCRGKNIIPIIKHLENSLNNLCKGDYEEAVKNIEKAISFDGNEIVQIKDAYESVRRLVNESLRHNH